MWPIPVAARSKAWVCGSSIDSVAGSTPARDMDVRLSFVSVTCLQVEVSETSRSLVQRSPRGYRVPKCDRESSIMRRPWPTRRFLAIKMTIARLFALLATL